MEIRWAHAGDVEALVEGNLRMARETEDLALDPLELRRGVEAALRDPARGRYLVDIRDGAPRGQLMLTTEWSDWRNCDVWWIQSVYVWPEHRRSGVYTGLHRRAEQEARAAGVCGLRLYVERTNHRAQSTYRALGMSDAHYAMFEVLF